MRNKKVLFSVALIAIVICSASSFLLNDVLVTSSPEYAYRYKVKFECGWQRAVIGTHFPTQRVPVETLVTTHINVVNPHEQVVAVRKKFVKIYSENQTQPPPTSWVHYTIGPNQGFEIDCEDVMSWPGFPVMLCESYWKGFVIIESTQKINVVAVYNKESADVINKITFHSLWWDPRITPIYLDTTIGKLELNKEYEITLPPLLFAAKSLDDGSLFYLTPTTWSTPVIAARIPFEPDDVFMEILDTETYFNFLNCTTEMRIRFILRPAKRLVEKYLDIVWPPEKRPIGFVWPDWIWPCRKYELIIKPLFITTGSIVNPEKIVKDQMISELKELGVPADIIEKYIITDCILPDIVEFDVAEGVGTSIDVEYIEPESIPAIT